MSVSNFDKLQRVQNTLARVVLRCGKFDSITSVLAELHWLPIKQRVTKSRLLLSTLSKKISHPTCVIFCVTMRHLAVGNRPLKIFYVASAAKLSAQVRSDMLPFTHGTICLVQFAIVKVCILLNLNLKDIYLNEFLLTVHTSHIVVIAPMNSFALHTAHYKFYLLSYFLHHIHHAWLGMPYSHVAMHHHDATSSSVTWYNDVVKHILQSHHVTDDCQDKFKDAAFSKAPKMTNINCALNYYGN